ncbi:unnamed protein product [Victoria cruziana]
MRSADVWKMKDQKPPQLSVLKRILVNCSAQVKEYGCCVAAKVPKVEHNMCAKEFLQLKACMQSTLRHKV